MCDMYFDKDGECYDYAETAEEMDALLEEMMFKGRQDFYQQTGVEAKELIGVPFLLIHNRIFTKEEDV